MHTKRIRSHIVVSVILSLSLSLSLLDIAPTVRDGLRTSEHVRHISFGSPVTLSALTATHCRQQDIVALRVQVLDQDLLVQTPWFCCRHLPGLGWSQEGNPYNAYNLTHGVLHLLHVWRRYLSLPSLALPRQLVGRWAFGGTHSLGSTQPNPQAGLGLLLSPRDSLCTAVPHVYLMRRRHSDVRIRRP